jgi:hypothetical protein
MSSWVRWALAAVAAAYIGFVAAVSITNEPGDAGFILGYIAAAFLVALGVRWLYLRFRPAEKRSGFWSLWILPIAAVALLLARIGNSGGG